MGVTSLLAPILLLAWGVGCQTQRSLVTYNITNALESLTENVLLLSSPPVNSLLSIQSLTPLTATAVQVESCPPGAYSGTDSQTCSLCAAGSYSQAVTATSVDTCIPCQIGKFSNTSGASSPATCVNCPNNTYGYMMSSPSIESCLRCPTNSFSYMGSQMLQSCICLPGYSGPNGLSLVTLSICYGRYHVTNPAIITGGPCSPCNNSVWCLNGQANPCPPNSNASLMSSSLAQCLCKPGYFGDTTMAGVGFPVLCQVCEEGGGYHWFLRVFFFVIQYPLSTPKQSHTFLRK